MTGAVVGVLTTVEIPGQTQPLVVAALLNPDRNVLISITVLAGAYVFAVELLVSYWIYQLFQMFRIARYLIKMESRLRTYLGIPQSIVLFGWSDESRGLADAELNATEKLAKPMKVALALSSVSQPASLYLAAMIGLVIFFTSFVAMLRLPTSPSRLVIISLGILGLFLLTSLSIFVFMHFELHKWIIGHSCLPFAGVFGQHKVQNEDKTSQQQVG